MSIQQDFMDLQVALSKDPYTSNMVQTLQQDSKAVPDFSLADNELFYKNRLVIPNHPALRQKLLQKLMIHYQEDMVDT